MKESERIEVDGREGVKEKRKTRLILKQGSRGGIGERESERERASVLSLLLMSHRRVLTQTENMRGERAEGGREREYRGREREGRKVRRR